MTSLSLRPHASGSRRPALLLAVVALVAVLLPWVARDADAADTTWTRVGTGMLQGVSGLAPHDAGGWVVVRDNKKAGQNRVALLGADGRLRPLGWPGVEPRDLEAVDNVPGKPGRYAVVTSGGAGRVVSIVGTTLRVVRSFTLPTGRLQNEAFVLRKRGGRTVALWGNRGSTTAPGRLFTATFRVGRGAFGATAKASLRVPFPTTAVRHVTDAAVVGGRIVVSSASDPGTSGPFDSALYDVGALTFSSGRPRLSLSTPRTLETHVGHKVEGIGCAGSTGLLGSDDEKLGGSTAPASFC